MLFLTTGFRIQGVTDKWMDGWMMNLESNIGFILEDDVLSQPSLRNLDLGAAWTCMDFS